MMIGQKIRDIRLKKGMTQEDLSVKTGISTRTIQRIELGKVEPRSYTLHIIADALETDYDQLVEQAGESEFDHKKENNFWLPLLHLSGLFLFLLPPLVIWILKKDAIEGMNHHGSDVINFQLTMWLIMIPCGIFAFLLITIPILMFIGIFSTAVIIINTIKVVNHHPYNYPLSIKFLKN